MRYGFVIFLLFVRSVLSPTLNHPSANSDTSKIAFIDSNGHLILVASDGTKQTQLSPMQITEFAWSPDGKTILFCACSKKRGDESNTPFYVVNIDSKEIFRVDDTRIGLLPRWSPDGKQIAFTNITNSQASFYIVNKDGTQKQRLLSTDGSFSFFGWSPNQKYIALKMYEVSGEGKLHILDVQTGKLSKTVINNFSGFDGFVWSPDSQYLALWHSIDNKSQTTVLNIENGQETIVGKGNDEGAIWLPASKRIIFSSSSDGLSHFWAVNADGSDLVDWTKDKNAADSYMSLSAQGDQIAFLSIDLAKGKYYLYIANVEGAKRTNLTEVDTTIEGGAEWSPDSKQLAFVMGEGDEAKLNIITIETKQIYTIGKLGKGVWFAWQPQGLSTNS